MTDTTRRNLLATGVAIGAATLSTGIAKAVQVEGLPIDSCPHCHASLGLGELHLADCPLAPTAVLPPDDEINPRLTRVAKKEKKTSACSSRCKERGDRRCNKVARR